MKKIVNNTKYACALILACGAMALGAAEAVISIPANIAGWGASKLFQAANKLAGHKEVQHYDNGEQIMNEIKDFDI